MERLTYRDGEGHARWRKELLEDDTGAAGELIRNTVVEYEDILGDNYDLDRLRELVEAAPVVHAEWVQVICHVEFEDGFVDRVYECCSACHMPNGRKQTDFCPHCGAKMDQ